MRSILFLPLFIITILAGQPVMAQASATFSFQPDEMYPASGETTNVTVNINPSGASVDTARLELRYDPSLIAIDAFELSDALPLTLPESAIDSAAGSVSWGAFTFDDPVTSSSPFATFTLRAKTTGQAVVRVDDRSRILSNGVEYMSGAQDQMLIVHIDGVVEDVPDASPDDEQVPTEPDENDATPTPNSGDDKELEQQALVFFGAFYARLPSNGNDWNALHCIAYGGCQGEPRQVQKEQDSLVIFGQKYARMPSTSMEWNVVHTLAYTEFLDY